MFHLLQLEGRFQDNFALLITPLLLSTLLVVVLQRFGFRKSQKLPPGPWPWPVVGNLFMLGKSPHTAFARFAEQYGPLVYLRLGSTHTVVASSPALAKEFLKTQDHVFQARPASLAFNILTNNLSMGVISGSTFRHVRRICVNELFTTKRLQLFQPMRTAEIHAMIKDIYVEAQDDKVIDLNFKLASLSTNNITQMLFRKRCCGVGTNQRETRWFKETVDEMFRWYGVFIIADYIPYLKWVTKLQGIDASLQALYTKLSTFIQQIIDEHRRNPNIVDNDTIKDFVDVLLTMPQEDGTGQLSDDTIQAIISVSGYY
jgi:cytochrome P450